MRIKNILGMRARNPLLVILALASEPALAAGPSFHTDGSGGTISPLSSINGSVLETSSDGINAAPAGTAASPLYVTGGGDSPTANTAQGLTPCSTGGAAASIVCKAAAGNLYGAYVAAPSAVGFLMVFNAASVPADGAVSPLECIPIAASSYGNVNYEPIPEAMSAGISLVFSTTGCFTKTTSTGTAFIHGAYR